MFKAYQSKPITRMAVEVTDDHLITKVDETTSTIVHQLSGDKALFKHYEPVKVGDYVIRLKEEDTYHCDRQVFLERNIVND